MVKYITERFRPKQGFAHYFHLSFVAVIPIIVFIFVRLELAGIALAVVLISKWRMLSVQPRYWLAHIRTNAMDLAFSLSILAFMLQTSSFSWQLLWTGVFLVWILFIKPAGNVLGVSAQAVIGQAAGLSAIFLAFSSAPLIVYMILAGVITYFAARHFFGSFVEPHNNMYAVIWSLLSINIIWVLGHWLVFVGYLAMPAVALFALSFSFAGLYYLKETDRLSPLIRKQIYSAVFGIMIILVIWLAYRTNIDI